MIRGTTPTLIFELPFPCDQIDILSIAFAQPETRWSPETQVILEKQLCDCQASGNELTLTLSENDTLRLNCHKDVEIQIRCKCGETYMASQIITSDVGRILKDGCL